MKINCDYCGAQIDTDKYDTCPNCGGGFDRDRELMQEKEKLSKVDDLYLEKKKLENERLRIENEKLRQASEQKKSSLPAGCMIVLGMLAALGVLFIVIMIFALSEPDEKPADSTQAVTAVPRQSISISISLDPIEIPEIPEINIPDITTE